MYVSEIWYTDIRNWIYGVWNAVYSLIESMISEIQYVKFLNYWHVYIRNFRFNSKTVFRARTFDLRRCCNCGLQTGISNSGAHLYQSNASCIIVGLFFHAALCLEKGPECSRSCDIARSIAWRPHAIAIVHRRPAWESKCQLLKSYGSGHRWMALYYCA